jgi:hypothetical protein
MAGLVPAIHVVQLAGGPNAWPTGRRQYKTAVRLDDVDGRDKPGHDAGAADLASPVSSKGTGRRPVRTRNDGERAWQRERPEHVDLVNSCH